MVRVRLSYEDWYRKVNLAVWNLAGCSADDLTDYCYRDAYEDGEGPVATARRAIRADCGED